MFTSDFKCFIVLCLLFTKFWFLLGEKKKKNVEKYIKIGPSPKKNEVNSSAATKASVLPKSSLLLPKKDKEVTKIEKPSQRSTQLSKLNEKKSILNQLKEKEDNFVVLRPKVISKDLKEKEEKLIVHRPKTILKELKEEENFIVLGPKERTKVVQDNSNLSFLTRKTSLKEIEKLQVKSFVQTDGNVVLTKNTNKQIGSEQNIVVLEENASNDEMSLDITHFMLQDSYEPTPKVPKTEKELKSSLAPFLKVKDKKKNLLTQVMSSAKVPDAQFLNIATKSGLHGKRIQVKSIVNQNGETVYFDKDGFSYLLNSSTNVSKSLKCFMFSEGCSAKAILYEKDKEFIYLKDDHNHESDFTETF